MENNEILDVKVLNEALVKEDEVIIMIKKISGLNQLFLTKIRT